MTTKNEKNKRWDVFEKHMTALAFILFAVTFVAAQLLHPNLFHAIRIENAEQWLSHFQGQNWLHLAHFLEFICSFFLMIMALQYKRFLKSSAPLLSSIGVYLAVMGAFMLLGNKSALCLTISGFDTLPAEELKQIIPALEVLLAKKSYLAVLHLLPLLPLGFLLIGIALFRTRLVPRWQSLLLIIGSALLNNPEIELVNFAASFFLLGGVLPYGIVLWKKASGEENNEKE